MANLAIKGHATRGKEVIEILKMLGGINTYKINYTEKNLLYCLREGDNVIIATYPNTSITNIFTLEEFLEEFPYKVGDTVTLDKLPCTIKGMSWDCDDVIYYVQGVDLLKGVYSKDKTLQPYKEENMEEIEEKAVNHVFDVEVISFDIAQRDKYELDLQGKFEVVLREGKYYVERIKPKYPNTYEECCEVLSLGEDGRLYTKGYKASIIQDFQKLLICRDAYWKIAGNWKPDIIDGDLYCIGYNGNVITWEMQGGCRFLVFPTAEMRDAFYDNFKDLIETCKEFL